MSDPFVGEIRMFAGNFAPQGWAFCHGQLVAVEDNDALFSLLGTIYGGDGRSTFGLPDLRGRIPVHAGDGPGLSPVRIGERGGAENAIVAPAELPVHNHRLRASTDPATNAADPVGDLTGDTGDTLLYAADPDTDTELAATAVGNAGGGAPHANVAPSLAIHFIISLFGTYPSS